MGDGENAKVYIFMEYQNENKRKDKSTTSNSM